MLEWNSRTKKIAFEPSIPVQWEIAKIQLVIISQKLSAKKIMVQLLHREKARDTLSTFGKLQDACFHRGQSPNLKSLGFIFLIWLHCAASTHEKLWILYLVHESFIDAIGNKLQRCLPVTLKSFTVFETLVYVKRWQSSPLVFFSRYEYDTDHYQCTVLYYDLSFQWNAYYFKQ